MNSVVRLMTNAKSNTGRTARDRTLAFRLMRMTVRSFDFIGVVKGFNGTPEQKLSEAHADQCGSGLAREGGGTSNINVTDRSPSRASPLPHLWFPPFLQYCF